MSIISLLGYFKLGIAFIKCIPQIYWNWKRKSTAGWSIANVMLDFTGGVFSFLQFFLELINNPDLEINVVKLVLAVFSVFIDVVFLIQHFCLYRTKER